MAKLADRFMLERELGTGGMARVFLGRDEVLDRPVAVKVLNPVHGGTDIGERFQREGRTAARLAHPNIVQVYDAGEGALDGHSSPYIVMEYVPGGDLKELIDRRGRLSGAELSRLGGEVCSGLTHAHERGVIHRDIKPHNILLDENGHAKVTDFGIARALDTSQATLTGAYLGTALYSSPEQLKGEKVTPKSDVYSLGVTLYQAATGEPPFSGGSPIEVASQHVSTAPAPLRERGVDVNEDLEALILACLAKEADDRPTAEEVRSRLEAVITAADATQAQTEAPAAARAAAPPRTERTRAKQPGADQTRTTPSAAPPPGGRTAARPAGGGGRRGRRGGALVVLALVAVLAVIGALAAPNLLGGSGEQGSGQGNAEQGNAEQGNAGQNNAQQDAPEGGNDGQPDGGAGGGSDNQGSEGSGGDQQAASGDEGASASSAPSGDAGQGGSGDDDPAEEQDDSPEKEAARAIEEVYEEIDDEDYEASYKLLSEGFKEDEALTQEGWASTFAELESVRFVEGPNAQVSGNTGTVEGVTIAENAGRTERNTVTWRVVNEDGEWKLDAITSFEQEIISG